MVCLDKVQRILIIKLRYIGDVLLVTPVIESLKRGIPHAAVAMLVNAGTEEVLGNNPYLDELFLVPRDRSWRRQLTLIHTLRSRRFDLVLDLTDGDRAAILGFLSGAGYRVGYDSEERLRGNLYHLTIRGDRDKMHVVDYHLRALETIGCTVEQRLPRIYPSGRERAFAEQLLEREGMLAGKHFAVIHPTARRWFKAWPLENFIELARGLHAKLGLSIVVVGGPEVMPLADRMMGACGPWCVTVAGRTGLLQLAALLERAALFVGNDAGPMHIAAAVGTPVVGLFGPTSPEVWGPVGVGHRVLWKQMDCTACWHHDCRQGELNCMRQISVEEAYDAARAVLNA